jgi:hypothetical protein
MLPMVPDKARLGESSNFFVLRSVDLRDEETIDKHGIEMKNLKKEMEEAIAAKGE